LLETRVLPYARSVFWTGVAVIAAGLLFTVWARVHLGRNWSGTIAIKESHDLITTGPYSLVRHPIYSGLLLGFLGSAIARAEWRGVLAVAIVTSALWRKLRIEESWLAREFGEAYATYRHRVATLVPFVL
jgi:protein-S-isoprenylcysteine O-methyltransferase Ste14